MAHQIKYGYDSKFPTRLREILDDRKMAQDVIAKELGVSRQCISSWKDGKTKPNIYYLFKLAEYLKVSADYLLGNGV